MEDKIDLADLREDNDLEILQSILTDCYKSSQFMTEQRDDVKFAMKMLEQAYINKFNELGKGKFIIAD